MRIKFLSIVLFIALMAIAPLFFSQSLINVGIQMLIAALFAMAFSLLCGGAGMLSFGHAAYFGIGSFAAIHAMNAFGGTGLVPTPLMPLVGAAVGLVGGFMAGWFSTKRTGVYFAMITLALAELLHALSPHLQGIFGGEAGISSFRMPAWGFDFGSITQVYYLTLFWVVVSIVLLYLYMITPMGRLTLGLRENSNRLRYLGYNVHMLGTAVFAISAMFSGLAGALQSMNIEAANYVVFEAPMSTAVVLNSFIGGVKVFLGPALGAAVMTFFNHMTSDLTRSWLLYQGLIFVFVMMFLPNGLLGELKERLRRGRSEKTATLVENLVRLIGTVVAAAGAVFAIEMLQRIFAMDYRANITSGQWQDIMLFGLNWSPLSVVTWLVAIVPFVIGLVMLVRVNAKIRARVEDTI